MVDLCRPSDAHPAQLLVAAIRKQQTYLLLLEVLSYYCDQGWTNHVFPWVVGIRGTIDPVSTEIYGYPVETLANSSGKDGPRLCQRVLLPPYSMLW
jgi:hypothetical protein